MVLKTGSTRPDLPVPSVRPSADHGSGHLGWKVFRPVKSVVRPANRINRTVPRTVRFNSFFSTVAVPRRQDPTLLRKLPSHPPHWKKKWELRVVVGCNDLQRISMMRRPSERRPVDLRKKVQPLGKLTGKLSPPTSPPVSELESPKEKITGAWWHWERTGFGREMRSHRRRRKKKWGGGRRPESSGEWRGPFLFYLRIRLATSIY